MKSIPTSTSSPSFIFFRYKYCRGIKLTKSRKRFKYDLTTLDFNNIGIHEVKYLPSSFDNDVSFVLPPMAMGAPSAYGRFMDGLDKMCNGYPWWTTNTTNIHNNFGFSFRHSFCDGCLQYPNDTCDYNYRNEGFATIASGMHQHLSQFLLEVRLLINLDWSVRYAIPYLCALICTSHVRSDTHMSVRFPMKSSPPGDYVLKVY